MVERGITMSTSEDFESNYKLLTGNSPFPWQRKLFTMFVDKRFPETCPVPTGLGKTSIIAIWLLAVAHHTRNGTVTEFPRRLVYVVNRRTVVDQATDEARKMLEALITKPELCAVADVLSSLATRADAVPLAISTLRGQFADNAEWRDDPARSAVIVGTVDMIGSRLLFSGYGCGFKSRPLHAGFLGQDTLLVHDEAHLEPAFQELVSAIASEQQRRRDFWQLRVMELTATSRSDITDANTLFTGEDRKHDVARKRLEAKKGISFHPVDDEKRVTEKVEQLTKGYKDSGQAILVFLRGVKEVMKVAAFLRKVVPDGVETLTGTLRGFERDALARENAVFARFMPHSEAIPQQGTVYLVCTSAGEVGVNISADHLVCDLTPFESMMQRFGRVNRFGDGNAHIDVVHRPFGKGSGFDESASAALEDDPAGGAASQDDLTAAAEPKKKEKLLSPFDRTCAQTLSVLKQLPLREDRRRDASPAALGEITLADRQAAFTPPPAILPTSDILFDAWALTSVRQKLPGRPPIADWLHGVTEWEPPATHIAWRDEVDMVSGMLEACPPEDLLEDYPLKPHELLRDQTTRVFFELEKIASRCPATPVWHLKADGKVDVLPLEKLVDRDKLRLADCTVLLPPAVGGLDGGLLNGDAAYDPKVVYDIADQWLDENDRQRRCRLWNDEASLPGMRLVRTIDVRPDADEQEEEGAETTVRRCWYWYVRPRSADDDGSRTARVNQELTSHLRSAEDYAKKLVERLGLGTLEAKGVVLAARWHDLGKDRLIWQRTIGNRDYPELVLAKSGSGMRPIDLSDYRHELGSLIDISNCPEFLELSAELQDLVLHLVAAHHGRARPHFPEKETFDYDRSEETVAAIVSEVPRRYGRLQRKYGRWGLAYLESLVRAADAMASQYVAGEDPADGNAALSQGGAR